MSDAREFIKGEFQIKNLFNDHTNGLVIISGKLNNGVLKQGDFIKINSQRLNIALLEVIGGVGYEHNILIHVPMDEFNRSGYGKVTGNKFDIVIDSTWTPRERKNS